MFRHSLIGLFASIILAAVPMSSALAQCPPAAPTGLSATDGTECDGITITWNAVSGADSYRVYRTASNQFTNETLIGSPIATSVRDFSTNVGVHWYYWVYAHRTLCLPADMLGARAGPNQGTRGIPPPPSNVQASDSTQCNGVEVTWNAVGGAIGYQVWRSTSTAFLDPVLVGPTPLLHLTDTGTDPGVTWYYAVLTTALCGTSDLSGSNAGTRAVVAPPSNVQATDGTVCHAVLVSWDPLSGATVYQVYRNTINNYSTASLIGTALDDDYSDTTAVGGVTYYYWVQATTSCGGTQPGAPDTGYNTVDLPAPGGLAFVPEHIGLLCGVVGLLWDPPEFGIEVWRSAIGDPQPTTYVAFSPSGYTQFTDSSLTLENHGVYNYWIRFRNACGPGPFCDPVVGYVSSPPPYEPMSGSASTSADCDHPGLGILVTWTPVTAHPAVIHYEVYRDGVLLESVLGANTSSYWDTGVQPGGQYTYRIVPVNACNVGNSTGDLIGVAVPRAALSTGPASQSVPAGFAAQFSATVTGQVSTLRWQHDGMDLSDGPHVSGATTTLLSISLVTSADAGAYRIVGDSTCGAIQSNSVTLTVPSCPPDFNNSGTVNVQDIFDFLAAWFSNAPAADFNHSGAATVQDIFDFLAAWFAGCS